MNITAARWLEVLTFCGVRLLAMLPAQFLAQVRLFAATWLQPSKVRYSRGRIDPIGDATQGDIGVHAEMPSRRIDALESHIANPHFNVRPLVLSTLLRGVGPSAVPWLVVLVGVFSVDAVTAAWALPHVSEEGLKVVAPLITHANPPATPIAVVLASRVVAAPFEAQPSEVFRTLFSVSPVTVSDQLLGANFQEIAVLAHRTSPFMRKASTRPGATPQVGSGREVLLAAIAETVPHARLLCLFNDQQPTEALPRDVYKFHAASIGNDRVNSNR